MKEDKTTADLWDYLLETGVATGGELSLVTTINGYSVETLRAVLYARTGFRSIEQMEGGQ